MVAVMVMAVLLFDCRSQVVAGTNYLVYVR